MPAHGPRCLLIFARRPGQPKLGAFLAFTLPRKGLYFYVYALGDPLGLGGS